MVITEALQVDPKPERSPHLRDRDMEVMEVTDLPQAVPKLDHNRSVETQDIMDMEAVEAARKLDHNLSTRVSPPLDPVENILKSRKREKDSVFESAPMNQLMAPRRSPKVRLGFGRAEKRMTK